MALIKVEVTWKTKKDMNIKEQSRCFNTIEEAKRFIKLLQYENIYGQVQVSEHYHY